MKNMPHLHVEMYKSELTNKEGLYLGKEVYRNLDTWHRCFLLHMGVLQLTNSTTEHNGLDVFSSLSSTTCQAI